MEIFHVVSITFVKQGSSEKKLETVDRSAKMKVVILKTIPSILIYFVHLKGFFIGKFIKKCGILTTDLILSLLAQLVAIEQILVNLNLPQYFYNELVIFS